MQVCVFVSEALRERRFVSTGEELARDVRVDVEPFALSPEARSGLWMLHHRMIEGVKPGTLWQSSTDNPAPEIVDPASVRIADERGAYDAPHVALVGNVIIADELPDAGQIAVWLAGLAPWRARLDEVAALREQRQTEHGQREAKRREARAAEQAALQAARDAERDRKNAERDAAEAAKVAWIEANGSDHLRRAIAGGYDCQRQYVTERAALEHPGFVVNFDGTADWRSRACPSPAALSLAEQTGGTVVWLTRGMDEDDDGGREVVVITGFLGKHGLIREIE